MNMQHLKHFVEVSEDLNISAAAKRLRLTQPALSRQMMVFENDTGWSLLKRSPKSISLTREGKIIQRLGKEMLASVDVIKKQMIREIEGGEISIGYAPSLAGDILRESIARFSQSHKNIRVNLSDCTNEEMLHGVINGSFDLMIGASNRLSGDVHVKWEPLREDEMFLAVPKQHAFISKRSIRPQDLDQEKLLILSRAEYPNYWQEVAAYYQSEGIRARVVGEFDGTSSLQLALEAGLGVALISKRTKLGELVHLKKILPQPQPICVGVGYLPQTKQFSWIKSFIKELKAVSAS
ncbi:MAG: LysR family transcriptional regulator [Akkermansiaceae bacterium]